MSAICIVVGIGHTRYRAINTILFVSMLVGIPAGIAGSAFEYLALKCCRSSGLNDPHVAWWQRDEEWYEEWYRKEVLRSESFGPEEFTDEGRRLRAIGRTLHALAMCCALAFAIAVLATIGS